MRLLMLASGDLWAGAEVMIHQLCCGLDEQSDLEILVVLLNHGRLEEELVRNGFEVRVMDEGILSTADLVRTLRGVVAEFAPDVIHSHRYKENVLAWLVTRMKRGARLVSTQHGMPESTGGGKGIGFRFRNWCFLRLLACCYDRVVAVSNEMRESLIESHGFRDGNTYVVHNGIRLPEDSAAEDRSRLTVGSAGRLFPVKNYALMVEIARLAAEAGAEVDFVLAGDGPEFDSLRRLVDRYGLRERFRFLGFTADMDAFYRGLDVYINTSLHEGIPMSVLEAMSRRLPVVASNVGGFGEIIEDGVSGYLVDGHDAAAFVEKITALLQAGHRETMACAARRRVEEHFSRSAMAGSYLRIYERLAGAKGRV